MTGTMVVCLSCQRVVWAHDAVDADLRGILNMMNMPCRLCGECGNFDGYKVSQKQATDMGAPGIWAAMRRVAEQQGFEWANSPNRRWFDGPQWANMRDAGWNEADIRRVIP